MWSFQLDRLAATLGLQSVLLATGNDIVMDHESGLAYESPESVGVRGNSFYCIYRLILNVGCEVS